MQYVFFEYRWGTRYGPHCHKGSPSHSHCANKRPLRARTSWNTNILRERFHCPAPKQSTFSIWNDLGPRCQTSSIFSKSPQTILDDGGNARLFHDFLIREILNFFNKSKHLFCVIRVSDHNELLGKGGMHRYEIAKLLAEQIGLTKTTLNEEDKLALPQGPIPQTGKYDPPHL
jgi:hypothetical protein